MKEKDKFISYIKNKLLNTHKRINSNEYFIKGIEAMQRIKIENKGNIKKKERRPKKKQQKWKTGKKTSNILNKKQAI